MTTAPQDLVALAERLAPPTGTSPWTVLGLCYAESAFGQALKPKGAAGTGDFIPRVCSPERDSRMKAAPLPGVRRLRLVQGIKERGVAGPVDAWVPSHTGWGCGLFQLDYEAHYGFCQSGAWKEPERAMAYALGILLGARTTLRAAFPNLAPEPLEEAAIASYNAGAARVARFLREGKPLDGATFHRGYVTKVTDKADALAGRERAWVPPQGAA